MKSIKTYIVNLETSVVRRKYMEELLCPYTFLSVEFIKAFDGRELTFQERIAVFDDISCVKHIGRLLNGGEIGCTLSHRKCYQTLLDSNDPFALILEDDIAPQRNLQEINNHDWDKWLNTTSPTVLFLSGDFWYYKRKPIVSVFDAVGTYSYFINRAAAKLILSLGKPYNAADDWALYRRKGLKMKAVFPYMIDANINMEVLSSDINQYEWGLNRKNMSFGEVIWSCYNSLIKKVMKKSGHFEKKIRVINNVIVDD